uniref:Chaperonin GroEL n=1 Tax=Olisthodiscus luteus TaxID=83000 RepID=A0A7U0KSE8_OLILU|nr:60-kDa chaperonin [Olisthodiscus luteus]QQW50512.1 60-kDa chaperonin [Olisthodiscus luteus]
MSKKLIYSDEARRALERGMKILVEAVGLTLGPKGRNVVIDTINGRPQIINDGVTIAKSIELTDSIENTGVALIRQAAAKTNDVAGDGTTTATVLAYEVVSNGMRLVSTGLNPISLKSGIDNITNYLVNKINEVAIAIQDSKRISQVAEISSGNDPIMGNLVATAFEKVGKDGIISVEEGNFNEPELEITEGMRFDRGFISPYFVTDVDKIETVYEDAYVLITDKVINLVQQELLPILEKIKPTNRPLVIIAENIESEALATLVLNKLRGILNVVAIRAPGFGDKRKNMLEDIAILTNGKVITEDAGLSLETAELEMLGQVKKIVVNQETTTIVTQGTEASVKKRCEQLRRQYQAADSTYEKQKLQERIAKLAGGVAIIKVGAATETELKDKTLRLEDAINATRAAIQEGIVPGGGTTYVHLAQNLETAIKSLLDKNEQPGGELVQKSLSAPLRRIAANAGQNAALILHKLNQIDDFSYGYDAQNLRFIDMYEAGIIDPAKVTRSALQNATSIAGMILTTECIIADLVEK